MSQLEQRTDRHDTLLTSLAILSVNWDQGRSFLDNFMPFVAECLRDASQAVTPAEVVSYLGEEFGLELPEASVKTLLRRATRLGYATRSGGAYMPEPKGLPTRRLLAARQDIEREIEALVARFIAFVREHHDKSLERANAEEILLDLVDDWSVPILEKSFRGKSLPSVQADGAREDRYFVATFVVHVAESEPESFRHLVHLVQGNMIRSALYLDDLGRVEERFRKTTAYLDTPFLLSALGLKGEEGEMAALEVLDLAKDLGVQLACFRSTFLELHGVILRNADAKRPRGQGQSLRHLPVERIPLVGSSTHLARLGSNLEEELARLGVPVRERPNWESQDNELEHDLTDRLAWYHSEDAANHDVQCIVSIHRLRSRQRKLRLEECEAIFITTNESLARISREVMSSGKEPGAPLTMVDHEFATLLWLKKPTQAPDLPRKQVIASCRAALDPSDELWCRYLDEIEVLSQRGDVDAEEYLLARNDFEIRRELMAASKGDPSKVTENMAAEILAATKQRIADQARQPLEHETRRLQAELNDHRRQRQQVENAYHEQIEADQEVAKSSIDKARRTGQTEGARAAARGVSQLIGQLVAWIALAILTVLLVVGALLGLDALDPIALPTWVVWPALGIAGLATALQLLTGKGLTVITPQIRSWVAEKVFSLIEPQLDSFESD